MKRDAMGVQELERRTTFQAAAVAGLKTRAEGDEGEASLIVGYAAVFYDGTPETEYRIWDDYVERLLPGAFDRALKDGDDVRALFNHDPDYVLGRSTAETLKLTADVKGLRYEIDPPDTQIARDVATSIGRKDITGSSFAFISEEEVFREIDQDGEELFIREIVSVRLYDVGPVTYPAYTGTEAGLAKRSIDSLQAWKQTRGRPRLVLAQRRLQQLEAECGIDRRAS